MSDKQKQKYIEGIAYLLLGILIACLSPVAGWFAAGFALLSGLWGIAMISVAGKMSDKTSSENDQK